MLDLMKLHAFVYAAESLSYSKAAKTSALRDFP